MTDKSGDSCLRTPPAPSEHVNYCYSNMTNSLPYIQTLAFLLFNCKPDLFVYISTECVFIKGNFSIPGPLYVLSLNDEITLTSYRNTERLSRKRTPLSPVSCSVSVRRLCSRAVEELLNHNTLVV